MLIALFLVSSLFTLIHITEELLGDGGPLWENFGRIVGVQLPDRLGFGLFTVGLPIALIAVAWVGYLVHVDIMLSLLIGLRLGDSVISHWGLRVTNLSNPNPGIYSTALYVLEAAVAFWLVDSLNWIWFGAGWVVFAGVLPGLWLTGIIIPKWRKLGGDV